MKRIAIYCGSKSGNRSQFTLDVQKLGEVIAKENIEVVYGGGRVGLMGVLANAVLAQGGRVTGVIPTGLFTNEVAHTELTDLITVEDMHARKAKMIQLSDGFIALPGGLGTLDEFFEVWTWCQLGIHNKPVGILNIDGYYDALLTFLNQMVGCGFLDAVFLEQLYVDTDSERLIQKLREYTPTKTKPTGVVR
jgi:uncharacterized protein (TIGR00730 family)